MSETKVDARGMSCPKPLIMVKKALTGLGPGEPLTVLLDNETAKDNVVRFLQDQGAGPVATKNRGVFSIRARKSRRDRPSARVEPSRGPEDGAKSFVMVFNRSGMGSGSEELGNILAQACVNAIKELNRLPSSIVFYNGGVHLACEGSPLIPSIQDLEARGVNVLVCGTCLDYFKLKPRLKAGTVSNLFDILQTIASAGSVFSP